MFIYLLKYGDTHIRDTNGGLSKELYSIVYLKIPIGLHNGSNYDYNFVIKELAEDFIEQFSCLGENTEKYIIFTIPIENEVTRIKKNEEKITKNISYILQFIDSERFMANSLSNLVKNLFEVIHRTKCKYGHDDKKYETWD